MGYTHYWYRPARSAIAPKAWQKIRNDISALLEATVVSTAYEYDQPRKLPRVGKSLIRFNGVGDDGHETFWFERKAPGQVHWRPGEPDIFSFCKTARKPYDRLVCSALAVIAEHDPSIIVHSDGDLEEWKPCLDWASQVLGRPIAYPITPER